jgi:hypothetical protein
MLLPNLQKRLDGRKAYQGQNPDIGGPTESVPKKYQFNSLEEAVDKILSAFQISDSERIQISNSVNGFLLLDLC